jgi:hypothetical protein
MRTSKQPRPGAPWKQLTFNGLPLVIDRSAIPRPDGLASMQGMGFLHGNMATRRAFQASEVQYSINWPGKPKYWTNNYQ